MRERLFDTMEQYYAHDFGNGRAGKGFYEQLLSAVRTAGSPQAIMEFETRFSSFLNPHQKHLAGDVGHLEGITDPEVTTAVQDRPRSEWGRVFAQYLAAFLGVHQSLIRRSASSLNSRVNSPSLHDPPPAPSKHLTRCLRNRVQAILGYTSLILISYRELRHALVGLMFPYY